LEEEADGTGVAKVGRGHEEAEDFSNKMNNQILHKKSTISIIKIWMEYLVTVTRILPMMPYKVTVS
jgi:hypothetical protein